MGQLPINLLADLKKQLRSNIGSADLFEMAANSSTSYYITLQDGDQNVVLKIKWRSRLGSI